jgi:hypothetical protein
MSRLVLTTLFLKQISYVPFPGYPVTAVVTVLSWLWVPFCHDYPVTAMPTGSVLTVRHSCPVKMSSLGYSG